MALYENYPIKLPEARKNCLIFLKVLLVSFPFTWRRKSLRPLATQPRSGTVAEPICWMIDPMRGPSVRIFLHLTQFYHREVSTGFICFSRPAWLQWANPSLGGWPSAYRLQKRSESNTGSWVVKRSFIQPSVPDVGGRLTRPGAFLAKKGSSK